MELAHLFITLASLTAWVFLVSVCWVEEMKAVWVLHFPCPVTVPGWTLRLPSVTSTGCSHVVS